jgi:hypothetical protein
MTVLHSGASGKFANNWLKIFGGKKSSGKASRGAKAGKARGASAAKSTKKKGATAARAGKPAAKKKLPARKSGR